VRKLVVSLALALALVLPAGPAAAARSIDDPSWESPRWPKNTVTINPVMMLYGAFNFEYERAISERVSIVAGPTYWNGKFLDSRLEIWVVDLGARIFATGQAPEGLFVSPRLSVFHGRVDGESTDAPSFAGSILFGYSWLIGRAFDLSLGVGGMFALLDEGEVRGAPIFRTALGVAF